METLYQEYHYPAIQDLKVTIQDSTLVFPSQETDKKSIFLSNLDLDLPLNFNVETVHFFSPDMDFPPQLAANKLKFALEKVLVTHDFLVGRLKLNSKTGQLEIDCNASSVGFVVATSLLALDEIGDSDYPNPAFRQLIVQSLENLGPNDQPLCIFQVTSFKCGGFAMSISTNHVLFDGMGFVIFLRNLASQAFDDKPLAIVPFKDRCLLAARSPSRVTFTHPELHKLDIPIDVERPSSQNLQTKLQ
ncbi:unnamed protein product [Fraxinus pennsylvanica]|uniref:Uncharacterized protein n=1 Tax=Fraxinus pennsylvanica TaxID=56036 RepID=A0AAD2DJL6_9LAMI|nr:unnamed protein product [Fraxinus pennsylvanica]